MAPTYRIGLFRTYVSPGAIDRVRDVLLSTWLNEGEVVRDFESRLSSVLGLQHPVAVNSGTAALHLALVCAGISHGDEVILPAQTFVATGTAVLMQGGVPVFVDIDPTTGNIDPKDLDRVLTKRTRAVLVVHWGGHPCDLEEVARFSAAHRLPVIEDAAHALGATYKGKPVGALSRFTTFSFQAIKHLTTGDGGALCCTAADDAHMAMTRRWFGIDRSVSRPNFLGARDQDIEVLGFKYHMNNMAAAVGLGNLEGFPSRLLRRREIAATYRRVLGSVPGIELPTLGEDRCPAYWLFTILVDRRDDFVRHMANEGVQCSVVDLGIDRNTLFAPYRRPLPGQRAFEERQVAIPVHDGLSEADVESVLAAIRTGW